jgi:uncharacterized protein YukE
MTGVETELGRMQSTAAEAARIGDELRAAVHRLDTAMSPLAKLAGEIANPFWQGHRNHNDAVTQLCTKLHQMSEGINGAKNRYASEDGASQAAFSQLSGAIDVTKL